MTDKNSAPERFPFVLGDDKADTHLLATSDLTRTGDRPVIDMLDAVRPAFESGKGVVCVQTGMSDDDLLATIKIALAFGQPFSVLPPTLPDEMHYFASDRSMDALRDATDRLRNTGAMGPFNTNDQ